MLAQMLAQHIKSLFFYGVCCLDLELGVSAERV
jgi:hypothetical protein